VSATRVGTDVSVVTTSPRGGAVACEIGSITGARPCNADPGPCHTVTTGNAVTTGNRVTTGLTTGLTAGRAAASGPVVESDPAVAL